MIHYNIYTNGLEVKGKQRTLKLRIESATRSGTWHTITMIMFCNCEAGSFNNNCRHVDEVVHALGLGKGLMFTEIEIFGDTEEGDESND